MYTPKVGTSDIDVKLCVIHLNNQRVKIGDIICEVETSKATYDIEAEYEGYVYIIHDLFKDIVVGSPLAIFSDTQLEDAELNEKISMLINNNEVNSYNSKITKKAQLLIDKYKLDVSIINKEIVTEKDIQDILNNIEQKNNLKDARFSKDDIIIVGIGGHAGMCIDILKQSNKFNLVGFIDDKITHDVKFGLKYWGNLNDIKMLAKRGLCNAILGIGFVGNLKKREKMYNYLIQFVEIPSIIHKNSIIEPSAKIDKGCQIMAGAIIGSNVFIGQNCIINSGSIVSHDSIISESTHITPGATLAGHVKIGRRVTVGMCTTIYIGVHISDDTIIANGKSVFENI